MTHRAVTQLAGMSQQMEALGEQLHTRVAAVNNILLYQLLLKTPPAEAFQQVVF